MQIPKEGNIPPRLNKTDMNNSETKQVSPFIKTRSYTQQKPVTRNIDTRKKNGSVKNTSARKQFKISNNKNNSQSPAMEITDTPNKANNSYGNGKENSLMEENKGLKSKLSQSKDKLLILGDNLITDSVISQYFCILGTKFVGLKDNILLMDPAVVQGIKTLNEISSLLEPMALLDKDIIIMPINDYEPSLDIDNQTNSSENYVKEDCRGSHWSILVFQKYTGQFYHYDSSSQNFNLPHAEIVSSKLASYLKPNHPTLKPIKGPTQKNNFDCGVYCLIVTDYILLNANKENLFSNLTIPEYNYLACIKKRAYVAYVLNVGSSIPRSALISLMSTQNEAINCPQEGLSKLVNENKKLHNELIEMKNFYQNGDVHITNGINFTLPTTNSFSVLEDLTPVQTETSSVQKLVAVQYPCTRYRSKPPVNKCQRKYTVLDQFATKSSSKKITLMCDSQGRDLANHLHRQMGKTYNVLGHVQPGAPLSKVVQSTESKFLHTYNHDDWVVIIGGCNDLSNLNNSKNIDSCSKNIINTLERHVQKFNNTNTLISTVPYRYDLHNGDRMHGLVASVNDKIRNLANKYSHVHLLDLNLLEQFQHTKHGFHINRRGKIRVTQLIYDIICKNSGITRIKEDCNDFGSSGINIVEQDMSNLLKEFRNNNSVAFAHCISGDLGHNRQMTAGVALKFRQEFGRPTIRNCIGNHLTYQNRDSGAGVYGLVTKLNYYEKPTLRDYDEAFTQLTTHFKKQNFKHLVCSPLGCVRDKVPLKHFISKIVQFHNITKAQVTVVTRNQYSAAKSLNNGLTYEEFVSTMKNLLNSELSKSTSTMQKQPKNIFLEEPSSPVSTSSPWQGWPSSEFHKSVSESASLYNNQKQSSDENKSDCAHPNNVLSLAGNDQLLSPQQKRLTMVLSTPTT